MKQKLVALLLIIGMLFSLFPSGALATPVKEITMIDVVSSVNFRTGPSTDASRIRFLKTGEQLEVISQPNRYWYEAKDASGVIGYVSTSSKYVSTWVKLNEESANGQVLATVSFRTGPSTSADRMRYLYPGELVWIIEQVNAYWYKLADENNVIGYASSNAKYIDTMFGIEQEPEEADFEQEPNGIIVSSVSFRKGPSTSQTRMRYLKKGEPVWILDKVNAYWYEVMDKEGVTGYISTSSKYVSTRYVEPWKLLTRAEAAEMAIAAGLTYLGTPYEFGSSRYDTTTFDCSDFIRQSYLDGIGITLPGDSRKQADFIKKKQQPVMDWRQLERGDLMFFMAYRGYKDSDYAGVNKLTETVRHVGIYLGNGQVLHTYSVASGGVRIDPIANSQWDKRFLYGGSVIQ